MHQIEAQPVNLDKNTIADGGTTATHSKAMVYGHMGQIGLDPPCGTDKNETMRP